MFSIRLKELREEQGFSQYSLANELGIAQATIGNWEAGKREPNLEMIIRLADFFKVSTDYLLGRTDDKHTYIAKMPPDMEGVKVVKYGTDQLTPEEIAALKRFLAEHKQD